MTHAPRKLGWVDIAEAIETKAPRVPSLHLLGIRARHPIPRVPTRRCGGGSPGKQQVSLLHVRRWPSRCCGGCHLSVQSYHAAVLGETRRRCRAVCSCPTLRVQPAPRTQRQRPAGSVHRGQLGLCAFLVLETISSRSRTRIARDLIVERVKPRPDSRESSSTIAQRESRAYAVFVPRSLDRSGRVGQVEPWQARAMVRIPLAVV